MDSHLTFGREKTSSDELATALDNYGGEREHLLWPVIVHGLVHELIEERADSAGTAPCKRSYASVRLAAKHASRGGILRKFLAFGAYRNYGEWLKELTERELQCLARGSHWELQYLVSHIGEGQVIARIREHPVFARLEEIPGMKCA